MNKDTYNCIDCNFTTSQKHHLEKHNNSKKHKIKLTGCKFCKILLNSYDEKNIHENQCLYNVNKNSDLNNLVDENKLLLKENTILKNINYELKLDYDIEIKKINNKHENILKEVNNKYENILKEVNNKYDNMLREYIDFLKNNANQVKNNNDNILKECIDFLKNNTNQANNNIFCNEINITNDAFSMIIDKFENINNCVTVNDEIIKTVIEDYITNNISKHLN